MRRWWRMRRRWLRRRRPELRHFLVAMQQRPEPYQVLQRRVILHQPRQLVGLHIPQPLWVGAGANNLCGKTNSQVWSFYQSLCGQSNQCAAQALCTALNCYASCSSLGGSQGCQYGFNTSACGLAGGTCNVGYNGSAFGESNNCSVNVFKLLQDCNARSSGGSLFGGSSGACNQASAVFSSINRS